MGLSVHLAVTPLLQRVHNRMTKGNKVNRPERQLAALTKQALRISVYMYIEYFEEQFTYGISRFIDKPMSCEAVDSVLSCPSGRFDTFRMLVLYLKFVSTYMPGFYKRTKNTCRRTRIKALNISMIQTLNFETLSIGKQ
jgi:hypothetical protein